MPIGVITNCSAVLFGGILGTIFGKFISKETEQALTVTFGLGAVAIGITSIMKYSATTPVILALILGTTIGNLLKLEKRIEGLFRRLLNALPLNSSHLDMDRYITIVVIFCASGFGIFGSLTEGITGDPTLLISKSVLDLFTAIIFAGAMGLSVSVIAFPQFLVFGALFLSAQMISPLISATAMNNFIACGGIMTMASGMKMAKIQSFPIGDMIPALILVPLMTNLWELLPF